MKWRAVMIVSILMVSTLFMGVSVRAQPFTGSIVLMEGSYNVQDYFEPSDTIYFEVEVLDNGTPLQSQIVNVVIYGQAGIGEVFNRTYTTDSYGQFNGYDWDDNWYTHDIGDYTMYVNYSGQKVVNTTFMIYVPVPWSATCWTSYYGDITDTFSEDQRVEVHVQAFDQHGNPFDGNYGDVWFQITHNGGTVDTEYLSTNYTGEDVEYFYPTYQYQSQFGYYMVTVFNDALPPDAIGFFNFTVILPNRALVWPQYNGNNRTVFTQGEYVGYEIFLFHSDTEPYDSDDYAARVLLFHEDDMENPLRNDTLRTDHEGRDVDYNFHYIDYGEPHRGTYYFRVYNHTWNIIGTGMFMVIEIDIQLLPLKSVYAQGDDVQVSVSTTMEDAYNVKITDRNHNGISGASWDVPAGTPEWRQEFTFPNINDGTYHVDAYMGSLLLDYMTFELKKFTIEARLSEYSLLPGQSGTLFWRAVNNHDGSPITIEADTGMDYTANDHSSRSDTLDDLAGSAGNFEFTVPKNAMSSSSAVIDINAIDSSGHTDSTSHIFTIGTLDVGISTDRTTYRPGNYVFMTFTSRVAGSDAIVPNVEIRAKVQNNGITIGETWTIMTDNSGRANYVYNVPEDSETGLYIIVMNSTLDENWDMKHDGTSDFIVSDDPVIVLILYQEMKVYSPGDTVNIPYRVLRDGRVIAGAHVSYEASLGDGYWGYTVSLGFGSGGVINFTLPAGIEGRLFIFARAITDDGFMAYDELENIEVSNAQLTLFTTKSIYLPGEEITWTYVLRGDTESDASYRITDPNGVLLAQGVPENGSFTFKLSEDYAETPTATLYVIGSAGTYITSDTAAVYEGYILEFRILKNSYRPGGVMKINYTIVKVGHGPEVIGGHSITINIIGEYTNTIWVTKDWGVLTYDLPENITDGKHIVMVTLTDAPQTFADTQTIIIDSNAGELAHGTIAGMNAGAFLVLLIALLGLVIAIIGAIKWRKMAKGARPTVKPAPPPVYEPQVPVEETVQEPAEGYPPQPPDNMETPAEPESQPGDYTLPPSTE